MKKLLICVFMFLVLAQIAIAATSVKSGWTDSGESVAVGTTSLLMLMSTTQVAADYGSGFVTVANDSCEYLDYIEICVDNIEYNHKTDIIRAYMRVSKRIPVLKITRTFSGEALMINGNATVTVTIENTGDVVAKNVAFIDYFPKEVGITDSDGVKVSGSYVTWDGLIKAGDSVELAYQINPKGEFDATLKAEVTYFDGFTTETVYSAAKRIKALPFFGITPILSRTEFSIDEIVNLSLNLSNKGADKVTIDYLDVTVDDNLEIIHAPSPFKRINQYTYRWSGSLPGAERYVTVNGATHRRYNTTSLQLRYKFNAKRPPSANIYFKARYTDSEGVSRETNQIKQTLTIVNRGVKVTSNMDDLTLESFQKKKMDVWLQNLNPYSDIKNVYVNISTFTYLPDRYYATMGPAVHDSIVEKTIYAPQVSTSTSYKLTVNVSYKTAFGDNHSYGYTTTFTVQPIKELLITKKFSSSSLESGETTSVTVTVKNQRKVKVSDVMISEEIPDDLIVTGTTSRKVNINPEDTLTAYIYTIKAPKVNEEKQYSLMTTARYIMKNITSATTTETPLSYSDNTSLTVKPRQLDLTVQKQIPATEIYTGEITDVTYRVSNTETEQTARNVVIIFPLQQEFDLFGRAQEYTIGTLGPGETVYVNNVEKIRAKYNYSDLTVVKTRVEYENDDGAKFHANSSTIKPTVKGAYTKGPYIIAYLDAPERSNNTDEFTVKLTLSNIGNEKAVVNATDTERIWKTTIGPNLNKSFVYKTRIATSGIVELPQVVVQYTYLNNTFLTGSNKLTVEIINRPLLSVEKIVPEKVRPFEEFSMRIKIKNLLGKSLSNVSIVDADHSWSLGRFSEEKELEYTTSLNTLGSVDLGKAKATYMFEGDLYSVESDAVSVLVADEKAIIIEKNISKADVNQSEKFTIALKIRNAAESSISDIIVTDGEETWTIDLDAGEEKIISYTTSLDEVKRYELDAASAVYMFASIEQTVKSNTLTVDVHESDVAIEEPEEVPEGILAKVLYYLKKIVTWQRN